MAQLNQADNHAVNVPRGGVRVEAPVIPVMPPNGSLADPILGSHPRIDTLSGAFVDNNGLAS